MLSIVTTILLFALVIGLVITIHEFGHFLAAKLSNIKVEEFYFGFGPRLVHRKWGETEYGIRLFPIGGYVKILGEEERVKDKRSFNMAPMKNRFLVMFGGIIMNVLLAVVLFYVLLAVDKFSYSGIPYYEDFKVVFGSQEVAYAFPPTALEVETGSPAEVAGLVAPFEITEVGGEAVANYDELKGAVSSQPGETVDLSVCDINTRNCHEVSVVVADDGSIGLGFAADVPVWRIVYTGVQRVFAGWLHLVNMLKAYFFILGKLISLSVQQKTIEPIAQTVTGPVGIFAIVDIVKKFGGVNGMIDLIAMLSLALAISNVFPFPALDGGQIALLVVEKVRGRPLNDRIKRWVFGVGIGMIFVLAFLIAVKDFVQFGAWAWLKDFLHRIF